MAQAARVTSLDALKDFKEALILFCERSRDALCAAQMESRRNADRLLYELPMQWDKAKREREEEFAQAKADLYRVRLARTSGHKVDDIEQKEALDLATKRLEQAEDKIEKVRRWGRVVQRAVEEYEGRAQRLADFVEGDPPDAVAFMERVMDSLDAYLLVAPPTGATDEPMKSSARNEPPTPSSGVSQPIHESMRQATATDVVPQPTPEEGTAANQDPKQTATRQESRSIKETPSW